jgi:hypothetical protein
MAMKKYRPADDAGENLSVDIMLPNTETGGDMLSVSSWPYEPKNDEEDAALANHPLLTSEESAPRASKGDK